MHYVDHCANCGSRSFGTWAASISAGRLHFGHCKCERCGLVFSKPQADAATVDGYYARSYYESHWDNLLIYAWHVIEHVLDLDGFVRKLERLLRPGGMLWIGTENYKNATHYLDKLGKLAQGAPPPFATSSEHTFVFSARTLADVVRRRGFKVLRCQAYQPTLPEKLEPMRFRSLLSRGYFLAQHGINEMCRTGPLLRLVARRKP